MHRLRSREPVSLLELVQGRSQRHRPSPLAFMRKGEPGSTSRGSPAAVDESHAVLGKRDRGVSVAPPKPLTDVLLRTLRCSPRFPSLQLDRRRHRYLVNEAI